MEFNNYKIQLQYINTFKFCSYVDFYTNRTIFRPSIIDAQEN